VGRLVLALAVGYWLVPHLPLAKAEAQGVGFRCIDFSSLVVWGSPIAIGVSGCGRYLNEVKNLYSAIYLIPASSVHA